MKETLIMIAAFALVFGILGYMNHSDIEACKARGHSEELCQHEFNR